MAQFELSALTKPISENEPCGPDLDAEGDDEFLGFIATAEAILPPDYFVPDESERGARKPFYLVKPYDALDFDAQITAGVKLNAKSHDLRLFLVLAKLQALNKDLTGFQTCVAAMSALLSEYWGAVHPRGEGDDFTLRTAALQSLDDSLISLALQNVPLITNRRYGAITYYRTLPATGKPGGDDKIDASEIARVLGDSQETELAALIETRDRLGNIRKALAQIETVYAEKLGKAALELKVLPPLLNRMHALFESAIVKRDPSAASSPMEQPPAGDGEGAEQSGATQGAALAPLPAIASTAEANAALAAVADYFSRSEPSNPALLLVRQAQALVGKSFFEAIQLLIPDQVQKAALRIGTDFPFDVPVSRLATLPPGAQPNGPGKPNGADQEPPRPAPEAKTRHEAVRLLEQVAAYYSVIEPSSAIPLLADRARALTGKDFAALLGDVLPPAKKS
jgi:type VI secretion system protein ImpA